MFFKRNERGVVFSEGLQTFLTVDGNKSESHRPLKNGNKELKTSSVPLKKWDTSIIV